MAAQVQKISASRARERVRGIRGLVIFIAIAAGCATDPPYRDGERMVLDGRYEEGLALIDSAVEAHPGDRELQARAARLRDISVLRLLAQADAVRRDSLDQAEALYQKALRIQPGNARAQSALERITVERRHRALVAQADTHLMRGELAAAERSLQAVLAQNPGQREALAASRKLEEAKAKPPAAPQLKADFAQRISMRFRNANLRSVLDALSEATGVNFVLDRDVRPDLVTTINVRDTSIQDIFRMLLTTNGLERQIVNESTVMIYPNTGQKQREYREMIVRTFYLGNADVKQTASMLSTIVKTRDIFVDEKLSMVVIRDTPEAVRLAESLIEAQDLAEPEVMLEVEVLEVASNRLQQLGIRFPDTVAVGLQGAAGVPGSFTLAEWNNRSSGLVRINVTDPLFLLSLKQQDGSTSVLANPRIRVKNREKAKIHIGDRVPVITTAAAAVGGFVSQSVSYLDVGLKFEVEPNVYLQDEVGIRVALEVSNIVRQVSIPGSAGTAGTLAYQIGTRNTNTVLRLHDGETEVLAGLISDEDRRSADRVPGLVELPIVGRLFANTSSNATKTEIVLLMTPRIVRPLVRPDPRVTQLPAGTDAAASGIGPAPPTIPRITPIPPPRPPPTPPSR